MWRPVKGTIFPLNLCNSSVGWPADRIMRWVTVCAVLDLFPLLFCADFSCLSVFLREIFVPRKTVTMKIHYTKLSNTFFTLKEGTQRERDFRPAFNRFLTNTLENQLFLWSKYHHPNPTKTAKPKTQESYGRIIIEDLCPPDSAGNSVSRSWCNHFFQRITFFFSFDSSIRVSSKSPLLVSVLTSRYTTWVLILIEARRVMQHFRSIN